MQLMMSNIEPMLSGLPASTRASYSTFITMFVVFAQSEGGLSRNVALRWKQSLIEADYAPNSINVALTAMRHFVNELAYYHDWSPYEVQKITSVKNMKSVGRKRGRWLTGKEARMLIDAPGTTVKGLRDHMVLALLLGCALRRQELASLRWGNIKKENGSIFLEFVGKGSKTRQVPIPGWVLKSLHRWAKVTGVEVESNIVRAVNRGDKVQGVNVTKKTIYEVVVRLGSEAGIGKVEPHDLRRTWAQHAYQKGYDIKQIGLILGHSSIRTTERYLGLDQVDLANPVVVEYGDKVR